MPADNETALPEPGLLRAKDDSLGNLALKGKDAMDSQSALDALLAEHGKKAGYSDEQIAAASGVRPQAKPAPTVSDTSSIDDAADKERAAREAAAKEAADKEAADKAAKEAADKEAADKAAAEKAAQEGAAPKIEAKPAAEAAKPATPPVDDKYDKIQLPPHSSAKASESFAALKKIAKEDLAAAHAQIADHQNKLTEATAELERLRKASTELPENVTKELTELRQFKVAHDVESDPSFQKFTTQIKSNEEAVYKKLMQAGYTEANIAKIKELGGIREVDWEPLMAKLPTTTKLFLQGVLVENEKLADSRETALAEAKANGQQFLAKRAEADSTELLNTANGYLKNLDWTAERPVPATATPEQRAEIEAGNKAAKEALDTVKMYLADRSPKRHAELAIGTLLAHRLQGQLNSATAKLSSLEAAHKTALETVTKERDVLKSELDRIKKAAVPGGGGHKPITPAPTVGKIISGGDALDQYAAEQLASRRA